MGRKKRNRAQLKPFCFYCDREFDDEKVLIQHQKAKHFKCMACNRKLDTATGLVVHMLQVHKETISRVPNAINGRENPDLIIHGVDGVPIELLNEKQALLDEERGAVRHSKSAHTTFGMSVMSGFFNQMQGGPHGVTPPGIMAPQFGMNQFGAGGQLNPFAMNQFMAHMQQGPQAAFTAMFGLPAPNLDPSSTSQQFPPIPMPPPKLPTTLSPTISGFSAPTSGFSALNIPVQQPQSTFTDTTAAIPNSSRLLGALSSTLAAGKAGARLMFDPSDDSMSPEEIRAQQPRYIQHCCTQA